MRSTPPLPSWPRTTSPGSLPIDEDEPRDERGDGDPVRVWPVALGSPGPRACVRRQSRYRHAGTPRVSNGGLAGRGSRGVCTTDTSLFLSTPTMIIKAPASRRRLDKRSNQPGAAQARRYRSASMAKRACAKSLAPRPFPHHSLERRNQPPHHMPIPARSMCGCPLREPTGPTVRHCPSELVGRSRERGPFVSGIVPRAGRATARIDRSGAVAEVSISAPHSTSDTRRLRRKCV